MKLLGVINPIENVVGIIRHRSASSRGVTDVLTLVIVFSDTSLIEPRAPFTSPTVAAYIVARDLALEIPLTAGISAACTS